MYLLLTGWQCVADDPPLPVKTYPGLHQAHQVLQESLVIGVIQAQFQCLTLKQVFKLFKDLLALKAPLDLKVLLDYVANVVREASLAKLP